MFVWEKIARILELSQSFDKHKNNFTCINSGRAGGRPDKVFRNWQRTLDVSNLVKSKYSRYFEVKPISCCFTVTWPQLGYFETPLLEVFSTDSPMGPFVGSDDHVVRVVNRNGNACRQARVHWLLASLVYFVFKCNHYIFVLTNV